MTKYLAFEGGVMTSPDVTVEISEADYLAAIAGMTEGKVVTISGGFAIVAPMASAPDTLPEEGAE
jgi:hypothetical protein